MTNPYCPKSDNRGNHKKREKTKSAETDNKSASPNQLKWRRGLSPGLGQQAPSAKYKRPPETRTHKRTQVPARSVQDLVNDEDKHETNTTRSEQIHHPKPQTPATIKI